MIKMPLAVVRVAAFCLPLGLLASCGQGSEAVQGTVVNFDPSGIGQATGAGASGSNGNIFRVELRSPTGNPQINVNVVIDSQYIVYEGRPRVDCSTIPCTAPGQTPLVLPHTALTNSNGTYEVTVIYSWNIAPVISTRGVFTAIEAFSGTGYGNSNITFTCSDPNAVGTAPDCPL